MSIFYKSLRVGKGGKFFYMYKFKTLKEGSDNGSFAGNESYLFMGKFLRKSRLDELPQIWNIIKRDMNFFGPRPEEPRGMAVLPEHMQKVLTSVRPGNLDLASIHFINEEHMLQLSDDPHKDYWTKIRPIKYTLQVFWIENRSFLLNLAILYMAIKKWIKHLWKG